MVPISETHPHLVTQWSTKNDRSVSEVSSGSHYRAVWECDLGHEWEAPVYSRAGAKSHGCKKCDVLARKKPKAHHLARRRSWYRDNTERLAENRRTRWSTDEEYRQRRLEIQKAYRERRDPEIRAEYMRLWRQENADALREYTRQYREDHPEQIAMWARNYRARKAVAPTEPYSAEQILDRYGSICYLCGAEIDLDAPRQPGSAGWQLGLHLDHVVPLIHGGSDLIVNIRGVHAVCNLRKSSKILAASAGVR